MDYVFWTIPAVFIALTLIVLIREIRSSKAVRRTVPANIPQESPDPMQELMDEALHSASVAVSPHPLVPCPKCGERLNEKNLRQHINRVHGDFVRCRICNCYIRTHRLARHNRVKHQCNTSSLLTPPMVPCPTCRQMVSLPNIASHLRRIHGAHYRGHQGYPHPFEAIFGVRDRLMQPPKPVIIDAANVICHFGKDDPRLQNLLSLLLLLRRQRLDFFCLLMPNSEKLLRQRQSPAHAEIYERILRYRRFFGVIPPNTLSAEIILALADYFGSALISNNKFRDFAGQYTWLNSRKRLIPFTISNNVLHLQGNQFSCDQGIGPLNKQLRKEFDQMRREASRGVIPKQNEL